MKIESIHIRNFRSIEDATLLLDDYSWSAVTDDTGSDTYDYDVFGATRSSTGTSDQPFRFTGEYQDVDVGEDRYYLRARLYDPALGRFLTKDPLPSGQAYAYARNNPANFVDPDGLCYRASRRGACIGVGRDGSVRDRFARRSKEGGNLSRGCEADIVGDVGLGFRPRAGLGIGVATGGSVALSIDDCGDVAIVGTASAGGGAAAGGGINFVSASLLFGGGNSDRAGAGGTAGGCAWWFLGGCVAFTAGDGIGGIQIDVGVGFGVAFFGTIDYSDVWDWRP